MKYRFTLRYEPTAGGSELMFDCHPLHGDDLSVSIEREEGEWYYTRSLDGKLTFCGEDYTHIVEDCPIDGTFTLYIMQSSDNGVNYYNYFTGTFSRASMEIDEDNHRATLSGLKSGIEDLIKNGKSEDYDLMRLVPESESKEVQGKVPPALAMVDYRSTNIEQSDIFCGGASVGNGYKASEETGWSETAKVNSDNNWNFLGIFTECKLKLTDGSSPANGSYAGILDYEFVQYYGYYPAGTLYASNGNRMEFDHDDISSNPPHVIVSHITVYDSNDTVLLSETNIGQPQVTSPISISVTGTSPSPINKIEFEFHYIRATLLTQSGGNADNVLDTGDYYKRMAAFNNDGGLVVDITTNTTEQPNGHRMVPGSDEYGATPQYFAPPDNSGNWIPLAEDNWNYASMWYTIQPSVANGLEDPGKYGSFAWTRCWTIGCCIRYLLNRITNGQVVFNESADYSQFLYGNPNPVQGHEPFQWLVTQKSNVMRPANTGSSRCTARLDWFLELLRNGFNCYYWFEKRNDGRYDFRIEHVEYFRRGGAYQGDLADQLDLTRLKPYRNFLRNGQLAKRYADQTNRYTFDLDNMVEKYTYSWQGDGGSDDFKGNPMYFKAGWIEKGTREDRQVDNIFADLGWLMLHAGTDTASGKNYDGLFLFGGYRPYDTSLWNENEPPLDRYLNDPGFASLSVWATIEEGYIVRTQKLNTQTQAIETIATYTGTGKPQRISLSFVQGQSNILPRIDFGNHYASHVIHRVHLDMLTNIFRVPNVSNLLRSGNYLQNGCLAWPWLQCEYLHYDISAVLWTYRKSEYSDSDILRWENDGTVKMVKKQTLAVVPVPNASTEDSIMNIMAVKTGLGIGIIDSAKINLSSRNAEMTIIYDINPQNNN